MNSRPIDLDDAGINASLESRFSSILELHIARRGILRGAIGTAVSAGLIGTVVASGGLKSALAGGVSTLTFGEVQHGPTKDMAVAPGYTAKVLIRWGDPVLANAPPFDPLQQTAAGQAVRLQQ
jgi:secreted PhoX family phosphatase